MPNRSTVNTEHTSIRLPFELVKGADAIAKATGLSRSDVMRIALNDFVAQRRLQP